MSTSPLTRRLAATLITGATAAIALASHADAATYCVQKPSCQGLQRSTVQSALDDAGASTEDDRVEIGASFLNGSVQSILPKGKLDIVGTGRDTTVLNVPDGTGNAIGAFMTGDITLSDLSVETGSKQQMGLFLDGGAHAERVRVTAKGSAADLTAAQVSRATVSGSELIAPQGTAVELISDEARLSDTELRAHDGIDAEPTVGDFARVERVRFVGQDGGRAVRGRTIIEDSAFFIENATNVAEGFGVFANGDDAQLTLRNVTMVGRTDKTHSAQGLSAYGINGSTARLHVRDSAFVGFDQPMKSFEAQGGSVDTSFKNVGRTTADTPQHNGDFVDDTPIALDGSEFANSLGHDAHPLKGSALIDAGSTLNTDAGLDLDRHERVVDGNGDGVARRDLGAYELQAPAAPTTPGDGGGPATTDPGTTTTTTPGTTTTNPGGTTTSAGTPAPTSPAGPGTTPPAAPAGDRTAPRLTRLALTRRAARGGTRLAVGLRSSEAANATVVVRHGKREVRRTVTLRKGVNAMAVRLTKALRLRKGSYRITVRATDAAGNRSAARTLRFRVR